jgi:hypothetical protein
MMDDYEDDYNPDECIHGVYYKDYCEKCNHADGLYQQHTAQQDWNHWHPAEDTE